MVAENSNPYTTCKEFGTLTFLEPVDLSGGVCINIVIVFTPHTISVYPDECPIHKTPGEGLKHRARVSIYITHISEYSTRQFVEVNGLVYIIYPMMEGHLCSKLLISRSIPFHNNMN